MTPVGKERWSSDWPSGVVRRRAADPAAEEAGSPIILPPGFDSR